jgi:hypothetical protein
MRVEPATECRAHLLLTNSRCQPMTQNRSFFFSGNSFESHAVRSTFRTRVTYIDFTRCRFASVQIE